MKLIIDTNILFSALLSADNDFAKLFFIEGLDFSACNFLFIEIFKHKEKLKSISDLSENEILRQMSTILSKITFINENYIPKHIFQKAYLLCKDIDENDTPFIALTMFLKATLLTGDKKLQKHLQEQGFDNIISLSDLKDEIQKK